MSGVTSETGPDHGGFMMEARTGIEPVYEVLQTSA